MSATRIESKRLTSMVKHLREKRHGADGDRSMHFSAEKSRLEAAKLVQRGVEDSVVDLGLRLSTTARLSYRLCNRTCRHHCEKWLWPRRRTFRLEMSRAGLQILHVCQYETGMPPQEESRLMQEADARASEAAGLQRQEEQEARDGTIRSFFTQLRNFVSPIRRASLHCRGALRKLTLI